VRDSGVAWTLPTYGYVLGMFAVLGIGLWKVIHTGGHPAPVRPLHSLPPMVVSTSAWLWLRAFASGCTAMTGVEAVSNAVPIFAEPRVKHARRTLFLICATLGLLLAGIGFLAHAYQIGARDQAAPDYESVVSQLVAAVVGRGPLYFITVGCLLAVLTLSANTSFVDFPRVCRILAEDSWLPSGFASLGRRLVYSFGIIALTLFSGALLIAFDGITDRLIPLFAVGAFAAFTFSQAGMVQHWRRLGRPWYSPTLLVNLLGAIATALALFVIVSAKFSEGAWVTILIIAVFVLLFSGIRHHYARLKREIRPPLTLQTWRIHPIKVVIPFDGWSRVTERALRVAMYISDQIAAVHVTTEESETELRETWNERVVGPARAAGWPVPQLEIIHSPYREVFKPLLEYVDRVADEDAEAIIAVVIPELVQPRWWEMLLHTHGAARLRAMLLLRAGERTVVLSAPWYLHSD
jgi:hypothetical protein